MNESCPAADFYGGTTTMMTLQAVLPSWLSNALQMLTNRLYIRQNSGWSICS